MTLIAGRNGVGKSTILALIAGASGLTRGREKDKTYFGILPNPSAEEILKLSYAKDFVEDESKKPHVFLNYEFCGTPFQKKGNVSGSEERLRIVPRNEPKQPLQIQGLKIPKDGKVPIPTIYLGMTRVLPVGEAEPDTPLVRSQIIMEAEDYQIYEEFTNRVISTGITAQTGKVTSHYVKGTKKRSVYPEYDGYDSTMVSLGQDSLSSIATAIASFNKLKRVLGADYRGGLLIVDELDAGFHPHAQIELLDELKSRARSLNIQVIATTHSLTMLQYAHIDIYNEKRKGTPLDQIIYLKGGRPIELLDASDFQAIHDDMHLRLRQAAVMQDVKIYVEDEEAVLFLNAILTPVVKRKLRANTKHNPKIVPAKVGCTHLIGLLKADEYFNSVVIVLDGDTTTINAGNAPNVVRLPTDPLNTNKQAPEVIIKAMCEKMCADDNAYPETRKKLRSVGGDTEYIQRRILDLQRGETRPANTVEADREVAKNWFNVRNQAVQDMKLIEGWVADNKESVESFIARLEKAILAAVGGAPSKFIADAKKGLAKARKKG